MQCRKVVAVWYFRSGVDDQGGFVKNGRARRKLRAKRLFPHFHPVRAHQRLFKKNCGGPVGAEILSLAPTGARNGEPATDPVSAWCRSAARSWPGRREIVPCLRIRLAAREYDFPVPHRDYGAIQANRSGSKAGRNSIPRLGTRKFPVIHRRQVAGPLRWIPPQQSPTLRKKPD